MSTLLTELMYAYKVGLKNLYYHNTNDGSDEVDVEKVLKEAAKPESGQFVLPTLPDLDEGDCDSCKI
ncbi:UNVERIFIED_ORG: hypothetical protein [Escherichia phage CMSTMSU]